MKPSWMHLCDNPDTMRSLGISPDSGENHMSLVTDVTCKDNIVRKDTPDGRVITYPVSVVTEGPFAAAHHIMRVFSATDNWDMGHLIGYVRIDWDENIVYYCRSWADTESMCPVGNDRSLMSVLREVLAFLRYAYNEQFDDLTDAVTYGELNVTSFTGLVVE